MSLTGESSSKHLNLKGELFNYRGHNDIKALKKMKSYLIEHFIEPLLRRELKRINFNIYNFAYITKVLQRYRHLDKAEIDIYLKIVEFVRNTVAVYNKNAEFEEKLYTTSGFVGIIKEVPMITLKAEYEIYKSMFGMPKLGNFGVQRLAALKNIIETYPGAEYNKVVRLFERNYPTLL